MPCSICHQKGHNKRTCPNVLITFNEAVVAPPTLNSSVEVEIGLLCLRFQLPKEVELVIQRLSRARPLLTQHDIEFSQSKMEITRMKKNQRGQNVWEQENGRRWSIEESTTMRFETGEGGERNFPKRCQMEWGKGNSKNKMEYKLYYAAVSGINAKIYNNYSKEYLIEKYDEIVEKIKKLDKGAKGVKNIKELNALREVRSCLYHTLCALHEDKERRPFKKLTMKSLYQYWG